MTTEFERNVRLLSIENAPSLMASKVVVDGNPADFNEAIRLAYFGQGYEQAKHDLWGLDQLRRTVKNADPQVMGFASVYDFYEMTTESLSLYDENQDLLERLDAFAQGINSYKNSSPLLPMEFYTHGLGGKFEEWSLVDTLAILKYIHFRMSESAIEAKLLRYDLL